MGLGYLKCAIKISSDYSQGYSPDYSPGFGALCSQDYRPALAIIQTII